MPGARVTAELAGDGSGFERMMGAANASVNRFEGTINSVKNRLAGLFALGTIEEGVRGIVTYATRIKDLARQTELSTEEVQRIGYAAKQSGLEFEDFQTALSRMGTARKDAAESNDALLHSFQRFGITLADLQNPSMRNVDLLYKMSAAIKDVNTTAGQRQELREFLGKSGDKLANALAHLDDFKSRAIISDKDIESIDRFDKSVQRLITGLKVVAAGPIASAADALQATGNLFEEDGLVENAWAYSHSTGDKKGEDLADKFRDTLSSSINPKELAAAKEALVSHLEETAGAEETVGGKEIYRNPIRQSRAQIAQEAKDHPPVSPPVAAVKTGNEELFINQRKTRLLEQQAKLMELAFQNSLKLLTPEERRMKLVEEINQLLFAAKKLEKEGNVMGGLELRQKREEEIGKLDEIKSPKIPNDSLSRVGNFLGGGVQNIPNIQNKIIQDNTGAIKTLTPTIKQLIDKMGEFIRSKIVENPDGAPLA